MSKETRIDSLTDNMANTTDERWREYLNEIIQESAREMIENYPIPKEIRVASFTSISNGRGRLSRRPREVKLLKVGRTTYQIKQGEVISRKGGGIKPDVMAKEVLYFLHDDEQTPERLLELLRIRDRKI